MEKEFQLKFNSDKSKFGFSKAFVVHRENSNIDEEFFQTLKRHELRKLICLHNPLLSAKQTEILMRVYLKKFVENLKLKNIIGEYNDLFCNFFSTSGSYEAGKYFCDYFESYCGNDRSKWETVFEGSGRRSHLLQLARQKLAVL